ncbi:MAG: glutamate 5-kinase [Candidatus Omnitrophica bacterium]|nr:glutamate 5-kinase [Candidatus Omnitrophota bacterium]
MKKYKRVVVKIGTKVITAKDRALDTDRMKSLVSQMAGLMNSGTEVILVTSGAIGAGMSLLGMKKRPVELASLQAAAAVGQNRLMQLYSEFFRPFKLHVGQVLLTQEDFNDRSRYLNIKHTINALIKHKSVPVINENDTVATEEIKCGDNDRLSSLVADICQADLLVLLTDVEGLLDEKGRVIREVSKITPQIMKLCGKSHCDLGTGGMVTKIEASRTATRAGIDCVIANGKEKDIIEKIVLGPEAAGTIFRGGKGGILARKRWIAFSSKAKGAVLVDSGAEVALRQKNKSLLASGIIGVTGNFRSGDVVSVAGKMGNEIAKGVANYSSHDLVKIKGLKTSAFKDVLGAAGPDEVIHKDNLVIL